MPGFVLTHSLSDSLAKSETMPTDQTPNTPLFVNYIGCQCRVVKEHYEHGGGVCLRLVSTEGEPIATATVNVPESNIPQDFVLIKNYSENQGILEILAQANIVTPTPIKVTVGYCQADLCQLNI